MENQKDTNELLPTESLTPCDHMTGLLSRYADGSLKGLPLLYTRFHNLQCSHCRATAEALQKMIAHLHVIGKRPAPDNQPLSPDERKDLELRLDAVEQELVHSGNLTN